MAWGRDGEPRLGARIDLPAAGAPHAARIFAETPGFVCEVRPEDAATFAAACREQRVEAQRLGEVLAAPRLQVLEAGKPQFDLDLMPLAAIWRAGLRPALVGRSAP